MGMFVKCEQCGRIVELRQSISYTVGGDEKLTPHYFCSPDHMKLFAATEGLDLTVDEEE